jgi:hypothetical protein
MKKLSNDILMRESSISRRWWSASRVALHSINRGSDRRHIFFLAAVNPPDYGKSPQK